MLSDQIRGNHNHLRNLCSIQTRIAKLLIHNSLFRPALRN
jgi:hypothetical protein